MLTVTDGIDPPLQAQVQINLEKDCYQRGEPFNEWKVFNKKTEEISVLPNNKISAILSDGNGGVWVGSSPTRLDEKGDKYVEGNLVHYSAQEEMPAILALYKKVV